jgi:hypothetical protein
MPVFVVGDVHGHRDALVELLRAAELLDSADRWSGADARLWLLGDLVDRGPDGVGALDLVMRLEREAPVRCLLGNHEAGLLAVWRFGSAGSGGPGGTFRRDWELNGGLAADLERLTPAHAAWLEELPAVAREGEWLLLHSDTALYLAYGHSVDEVNRRIGDVLAGDDPQATDELLAVLADRHAFHDPAAAPLVLEVLGGTRLVHGHTPICIVTGADPRSVVEPLAYAGGRALNVDHCLFAGGPGFVVRLG